MTEQAHIIHPDVEVGEKALTWCRIKLKKEIDWDDIPADKPICRDCVDALIIAANSANDSVCDLIELLTVIRPMILQGLLEAKNNEMQTFLAAADAYQEQRTTKRDAKTAKSKSKAALKKAKKSPEV